MISNTVLYTCKFVLRTIYVQGIYYIFGQCLFLIHSFLIIRPISIMGRGATKAFYRKLFFFDIILSAFFLIKTNPYKSGS